MARRAEFIRAVGVDPAALEVVRYGVLVYSSNVFAMLCLRQIGAVISDHATT